MSSTTPQSSIAAARAARNIARALAMTTTTTEEGNGITSITITTTEGNAVTLLDAASVRVIDGICKRQGLIWWCDYSRSTATLLTATKLY